MAHLWTKAEASKFKKFQSAKDKYDKQHAELMELVSKKGAFYEKIEHKNLMKPPTGRKTMKPPHFTSEEYAAMPPKMREEMKALLADPDKVIREDREKERMSLPVRGRMVAPRLSETPEIGRPEDIVARKHSRRSEHPDNVGHEVAKPKAPKNTVVKSKGAQTLASNVEADVVLPGPRKNAMVESKGTQASGVGSRANAMAEAWKLKKADPSLSLSDALKRAHGK